MVLDSIFELSLESLTFYKVKVWLELVSAHTLKSLEVWEIDCLSYELAKAINVAWLIIAVKNSRLHSHFFCQLKVSDLQN